MLVLVGVVEVEGGVVVQEHKVTTDASRRKMYK